MDGWKGLSEGEFCRTTEIRFLVFGRQVHSTTSTNRRKESRLRKRKQVTDQTTIGNGSQL